eukprot:9474037-Pyramimonas_sp.AAC.1
MARRLLGWCHDTSAPNIGRRPTASPSALSSLRRKALARRSTAPARAVNGGRKLCGFGVADAVLILHLAVALLH